MIETKLPVEGDNAFGRPNDNIGIGNEPSVFQVTSRLISISEILEYLKDEDPQFGMFLEEYRVPFISAILEELLGDKTNCAESKFGTYDEMVSTIANKVRANQTNRRLVNPGSVLEIVAEYGIGWAPSETKQALTYASLAMLPYFFAYESIRAASIGAGLNIAETKNALLLILPLYSFSIITAMTAEWLRMKAGKPFVFNPQVTVLSLGFKPEYSGLIFRIPKLVTEISAFIAAAVVDERVMIGLMLASSIWNFIDTVANSGGLDCADRIIDLVNELGTGFEGWKTDKESPLVSNNKSSQKHYPINLRRDPRIFSD